MIKKLESLLRDVNLSQNRGRFLSDKSYAYDTLFFVSKFILANLNESLIFNKNNNSEKIKLYLQDIFQITEKGSGTLNYFTEALNVLEYGNVIEQNQNAQYKILELDILTYICDKVENSYIYLYLITYFTFINDGLIDLFKKLLLTPLSNKTKVAKELLNAFTKVNPNIGKRYGDKETTWQYLSIKYPVVVLGYINDCNYMARTLNFKEDIISAENISINVEGTKSNKQYPKKNDYIETFDKEYIVQSLQPYLLINTRVNNKHVYKGDNIATNLADLKIEILNSKQSTMTDYEKEQYVESKIIQRNPAIQTKFRSELKKNNKCKCAICEFGLERFLVASHIKPYSKCEDTYDAINYQNGLLLCPNHDKLFESARFMTIDAYTGKIILSAEILKSKEFGNLNGESIDSCLIKCERKHYLEWHNKEFKKYNT